MIREQFTISKSETGYTLTEVNTNRQEFIEPNHPKFEWITNNLGRIININESGRWNSQKDYENYYKKQLKTDKDTVMIKPEVDVKLTKLSELDVNPELFVPLYTNTIFDKFVTSEGGFLPGSNIMAAGAPGVGKTTVLLELISKLDQAGKKCLFISAEMNRIDMARYLKRFPHWGQLPILFLSDYEDYPKEAIEKVINEGWDIVLTDSYTEVNDMVKEQNNMNRTKAEKWFLNLMSSNNVGNNKEHKHTTFITILQLSKGGDFVGSNKLKHMTTAMMHLTWDGNENSGKRYIEFTKNRLGQVNKKLYYNLNNGVNFDEDRYLRDLHNDEIIEAEQIQLNKEFDAFDRLFGVGIEEVAEEIAEEIAE